MGLSPFRVSPSSYDSPTKTVKVIVEHVNVSRPSPVPMVVRRERVRRRPLPNPNPKNFVILRSQRIGAYLIMEIHYPDCTNYEGHKVLLFKGTTREKLLNQGSIDPHFSNNKRMISPIARFEPTPTGWSMARKVARK